VPACQLRLGEVRGSRILVGGPSHRPGRLHSAGDAMTASFTTHEAALTQNRHH
jgi:hypothetical protein